MIRVLPKNLANMIAAGEVIERPASVVKELVENSIDSRATHITVEIKNGGKTYIRVTDDGCGMSEEDAKIAFLRHATSKIDCEEDLFNINTMGFRGEALAAIAAVSRIELRTAASTERFGTEICLEAGQITSCQEVGLPSGTTMIVRDLFFNTPARMNFMKKDSTENANIVSLVNRLAIGNPFISFKLITDGRTILSTDNSMSPREIVYTVLGEEIGTQLFPVDVTTPDIMITGFAGSPKCSRSNRNFQLFFVNRRTIKNKTITAAVDKAYHNLLMNGKYAVCVLLITVANDKVDVNVHPTKMEVKFADEKKLFDAVYYGVKDALNGETQINMTVSNFFGEQIDESDMAEPQVVINREENAVSESYDEKMPFSPGLYSGINVQRDDFDTGLINDNNSNTMLVYGDENERIICDTSGLEGFDLDDDDSDISVDVYNRNSKEKPMIDINLMHESGLFTRRKLIGFDELSDVFAPGIDDTSYMLKKDIPYRYVGEIFKTYIIIESGSSFYLVDKHAAHERVIFDKLYEMYRTSSKYSQQLLASVPVTLSPEEADAAHLNRDKLLQLGYEFDNFGDNDIILRAVPCVLTNGDMVATFTETLNMLIQDKDMEMSDFENRELKMLACKAAIKAGFDTSDEELEAFIKKLLIEGDAKYCPHGRPIICEYTKQSIEKAFKRVL